MARGYSGGQSFGVQVKGLEEASKIPEWLDYAQEEFVDDFARRIARNIASKISSKTHRLAQSWRGHAISPNAGIVESRTTQYAKAQNRGAYITPKKGLALRFKGTNEYEGQTIFVRKDRRTGVKGGVRITGQQYVRRGLRDRRRIVLEAFDQHFGNIKRGL